MIFDANTFFGIRPSSGGGTSLDDLLGYMKRFGIDKALTYSLRGIHYDFSEGNDEVLAASQKYPNLVPVATIDPRRYVGCLEEVDKRADQGFKFIRFFPEREGWSLTHPLFKKILAKMGQRKMAAIVSCNGNGVAAELAELAKPYSVPIIMLEVSYCSMAEALGVMKDYSLAYMENNKLNTPDPVELTEAEVGPGRVLFGSGLPSLYPGSSRLMVTNAKVSQESRDGVMGKNLEKLMATLGTPKDTKYEILKEFKSRDGLDVKVTRSCWPLNLESAETKPPFKCPVIDIHCHAGRWSFPTASDGIEGFVELMARYGIVKAVISSSVAVCYDMKEGNRRLEEDMKKYPQCYGYVTVNPNDLEGSKEQLAAHLKNPQFVGAKIHPDYAGKFMGSKEMQDLFDLIAPYKKPVLIHTWGPEAVEALKQAAIKHPELPIVVGHMGGSGWHEAGKAAAEVPNMYIEFCCSYSELPKVEYAIETVGSDKVMFGSDMDLFNPAFILGMVEDADLSEEIKEKILHKNAEKLYKF